MRTSHPSVTRLLLAGALLAPGTLSAQVAPEPETEQRGADRHQVKDGETLSSVAERELGSADAWPKLWSYNPEITNPHYIYPGHVLRVKEGVDLGAAAGGTGDGATASRGLLFANRRTPRVGPGVVRFGEQVYLDRDALAKAGHIAGSHEDHLMLSPSDQVYLKFDAQDAAPTPGREMTVFLRLHRDELAPRAHKLRTYDQQEGGEVVRVMGALRVLNFDPEKRIARALVTEALEPLERGFEVADLPRQLPEVAVRKNATDVKAKIIAATRALSTLGEGQLVFVDAGSKRGVEVGNRFVVLRQGDTWRQQLVQREELSGAERPNPKPLADSAYPEEAIAELRVMYVRPDSATVLITSSEGELSPGERVEMRAGF